MAKATRKKSNAQLRKQAIAQFQRKMVGLADLILDLATACRKLRGSELAWLFVVKRIAEDCGLDENDAENLLVEITHLDHALKAATT